MGRLDGRVAWVTGAGSGIGEAAAEALAEEGANLVLSGRRRGPLDALASRLVAKGSVAEVQEGDLTQPETSARIAAFITDRFGRLDILINNAGDNIAERGWDVLAPAGVQHVIGINLAAAFYCVTAALPLMRARKDGVIINTASEDGRFVFPLGGPAYTAAKHGVVAMSHSINMEECTNGIRSTALCPGEVATAILDKRPVPVGDEERARMLQPADCGELICTIACLPPRICLNEVLITPTLNRNYVERGGRGARSGVTHEERG